MFNTALSGGVNGRTGPQPSVTCLAGMYAYPISQKLTAPIQEPATGRRNRQNRQLLSSVDEKPELLPVSLSAQIAQGPPRPSLMSASSHRKNRPRRRYRWHGGWRAVCPDGFDFRHLSANDRHQSRAPAYGPAISPAMTDPPGNRRAALFLPQSAEQDWWRGQAKMECVIKSLSSYMQMVFFGEFTTNRSGGSDVKN